MCSQPPRDKQLLNQAMDELYPRLRSLLLEIGGATAFHFSTDAEQDRLSLCLQNSDSETKDLALRFGLAIEEITHQAAQAATLAVLTIALGSPLD